MPRKRYKPEEIVGSCASASSASQQGGDLAIAIAAVLVVNAGTTAAAKAYLKARAEQLGIVTLLDRDQLTKLYGDPFNNNRTPDFAAITLHGLIYSSGSKLAEHGGFADDDRNVALLVSNPKLHQKVINADVETRQIDPTILRALSFDPKELQAVRQEYTEAFPGVE
jgi:hypothetical protein